MNETKTKAMVFRQSGRRSKNDVWWYGGKKIDTVTDFKYLGMTFSANGSFRKHVSALSGSVRKALFQLTKFRWRFKGLTIKTLTLLFDTMLKPVILYGAEVYSPQLSSVQHINMIDCGHNQWCKTMLGIPRSTGNGGAVYELGRQKLATTGKTAAIKYLLKCATRPRERLVYLALKSQIGMAEKGYKCWGSGVKRSLDQAGLGFLWGKCYEVGHNTNKVEGVVKIRFNDIDRVELLSSMHDSKLLKDFASYKKEPEAAKYLSTAPQSERRIISLFRLNCIWSLPICKLDEGVYKCNMCHATFPRGFSWSHFLYHCKSLPPCSLTSKPDPSSEVIFRKTERNCFTKCDFFERLRTIVQKSRIV